MALAFAVAYSFNSVFTGYADSLHQMAYSQVTLLGVVYAWLRFEASTAERSRRAWLGVVPAVKRL